MDLRSPFQEPCLWLAFQPTIQRVKEAVAEIKAAARQDPVPGAEGAVLLLKKLSPALEQMDSSSGATGLDVLDAYDFTMEAAVNAGCREETLIRIRALVESDPAANPFVRKIPGPALEIRTPASR